jgi:hypothetical protein
MTSPNCGLRSWSLTLSGLLLLAACGGGGGGGIQAPLAELSALRVSTGELSPSFAARTTEYVVGSALLAASVRVTPTAREPGATIEVRGVATASGAPSLPIPLPGGVTPVDVTVTSADRTLVTTYTIVFVRGEPGAQEAYVKASNPDQDDIFGVSVALDGNTLVVGAPGESSAARGVDPGPAAEANDDATAAGAVYVFVRSAGTWSQQAYLKASNADAFDFFGMSVAVSGNTIVVGAPGESGSGRGTDLPPSAQDSNDAPAAGAAYVFVRSGTTWTQQAYVKASNPTSGDEFGDAVAISGDTFVVGAQFEDSAARGVNRGAAAEADDSTNAVGAAYVFVRSGSAWSQQAYLKASNSERDDFFGAAVAISKDTVVVGAIGEDGAGQGANPGGGVEFLDGASRSGAVYVFVREGTLWSQQAYVKASNTGVDDFFGFSVAVSGDTFVAGAIGESSAAPGVNPGAAAEADDSARAAGAAYVFQRTGTSWSQQAYLKASNPDGEDVFGIAVAIDGEALVVGAQLESGAATGVNPGAAAEANDDAPSAGAAYVFLRTGATWTQVGYVKASNTDGGDEFGGAVAISGDTLAVGARLEHSAATGVNPGPAAEADDSRFGAGAVYVLR